MLRLPTPSWPSAFRAAAKAGAEPYEDSQRITFYFYLGIAGGLHKRVDMLDAAIAALEEDAEDNPQLAQRIKQWKDVREAMRKKAPDSD